MWPFAYKALRVCFSFQVFARGNKITEGCEEKNILGNHLIQYDSIGIENTKRKLNTAVVSHV